LLLGHGLWAVTEAGVTGQLMFRRSSEGQDLTSTGGGVGEGMTTISKVLSWCWTVVVVDGVVLGTVVGRVVLGRTVGSSVDVFTTSECWKC